MKEFNAEEFISLTARISDLLEKEIEIIKRMKLSELHKFKEQKIALFQQLEAYKNYLFENPGTLKKLSSSLIERVKTEAKRFEEVIEEDKKQLLKAKRVHSMVMDAVKKVISKKISPATGYSNTGFAYSMINNVKHTPPVTLNKNI